MSSVNAPSETLHFPLQKLSPFSSVSLMSGLWEESHHPQSQGNAQVKVGCIIYVGIIPSLPWLLTFSILQARLQQHGYEFLVQT